MYRIAVVDETLPESDFEIWKSGSFFGHDNRLKVILPDERELPTHLILTLNTVEFAMGEVIADFGSVIRLLHPFHYSQGGSFVYSHHGSDSVSFVQFDEKADASWPYEGFPYTLATRKIHLENLASRPQHNYDNLKNICVGSDIPTIQNYDNIKCVGCKEGVPHLIATVPNQPICGLQLWNDDYVNILFWFCPACKVVITHNEYD